MAREQRGLPWGEAFHSLATRVQPASLGRFAGLPHSCKHTTRVVRFLKSALSFENFSTPPPLMFQVMILFAPPTLLDRVTIWRFSTRFDARDILTISDPHSWLWLWVAFMGFLSSAARELVTKCDDSSMAR